MRIILIGILIFGWVLNPVQAQQSILSAGGNGSGAGGSFSYSIGQIDYVSFGNSNITIEQGVQHSYNSRSIVNLKLFIEGYYESGGFMKSVMNNQDYLSPITDVEYINVELRSPNTPYPILHSTTALLKTNGTAICNFDSAPNGLFYIVIKTRNAIQTWSATPQPIGTTPLTYDFTNASTKAYGNNMKEIENGIFVIYSGDLNQDENIDTLDYTLWEADSNNFAYGYYSTDINGDGNVDTIDYSIWEINSNNFVYSVYPTF